MRQEHVIVGFNRGRVSQYGIARVDVKRIAMAAETQTNWVPRVLGSMSLRPGMQYLGATKSNNAARYLPFVYSTTDTALLEFTDSVLRIWSNDSLLSRVSVTSAVSNGSFTLTTTGCTISNASPGVVTYVGADIFANNDPVTFFTSGSLPSPLSPGIIYYVRNVNAGANTFEVANAPGGASINTTTAGSGTHTVGACNIIASWTDNDQVGATSSWSILGLALAGTGTNAAIRDQTVTVAAGDQNKLHAVRIVVYRGRVTVRIGTSTTDDSYINETTLGTGTHSLAFTPTGNFNIRLMNRQKVAVYVTSAAIEAAGTFELPSPYPAASLQYIRGDQSGNYVFLACKDYQQRVIQRRGTSSWSIELYQPDDGPFGNINTEAIYLTPDTLSGSGTLTASQSFFRSTHVGALFQLISEGQTESATIAAQNTFTDPIEVTGVGSDRTFTIQLTGTWTASTVRLQRSIGVVGAWSDVTGKSWTADTVETYADGLDNQTVYYRIGIKTGEYAGADSIVCSLSIATGSIVGVVRVASYVSSTLVTIDVLSDLGNLSATDLWREGEWSDKNGWPTAVALHEGRLWWSGKAKVWGSISDAYDSFNTETVGDSGVISRSFGSGPVDVISWMSSNQRLLIGSQGQEYSARASALDEPLTPTAFVIKPASNQGSGNVEAVKIDNRCVFVQRNGSRVYELAYDSRWYDYSAKDLTAIIPEIGYPGITRIAVQRQVDTRIHCVKSDGTAALMVLDKNEEMQCWVDIETDGDIEDVVVLPAPNGYLDDYVYYVVKRTINGGTVRYLEKWAQQTDCIGGTLNKQADAFVVISQASSTTISGLSHLEGEQVAVWANGEDIGTDTDYTYRYTVSGGAITVASAVTDAVVGLPYTAQFKSMKLGSPANDTSGVLNHYKNINHMGLVMAYTHRMGVRYGPDFTNLDSLPALERGIPVSQQAEVYTAYDEQPIEFPGTWDTDARVCLQAQAPRPCTLLAVTLDMEKT